MYVEGVLGCIEKGGGYVTVTVQEQKHAGYYCSVDTLIFFRIETPSATEEG